jgi:hypothetical protein
MVSTRLFVGNLPYDASEDALRAAFSEHGEVTEVFVVHDRYTQAACAAHKLNGATMQGKPLRVNEAEGRLRR